jgi:hypothetical protein
MFNYNQINKKFQHCKFAELAQNASTRLLSLKTKHKENNLASSLRTPAASDLVENQTQRERGSLASGSNCQAARRRE